MFPHNLTSASALPGETRKHENRIFFTQTLYYCFARLQLWLLVDFFNLVDSQLVHVLPYDSLNLVVNRIQLWLSGHWSGERKSGISQCSN